MAERPHPLGGSRRFRLDEMEDFDDIPWWIRNTETRETHCEGSLYLSDILTGNVAMLSVFVSCGFCQQVRE